MPEGAADLRCEASAPSRNLLNRLSPAWASALQIVGIQKTARALSRVNAAEDYWPGSSAEVGSLSSFYQFAVQPVEVLVTFDQELLNEVIQGRLPRKSDCVQRAILCAPSHFIGQQGEFL